MIIGIASVPLAMGSAAIKSVLWTKNIPNTSRRYPQVSVTGNVESEERDILLKQNFDH